MMIDILNYPDIRLKKCGDFVSDINDSYVQKMIADMFETLYNTKDCCGLASTQMNFESPLAITVIDVSPQKNEPRCLVNPIIIESKGHTHYREGCMSVYPSFIDAAVKRAEWVKVEALNEKGEKIVIESADFLAKCLQHEIDHLNGKLYLDLLPRFRREKIDKKIKKLLKKT
ncbi:MAG: peptide deformylase [Legionellales bacterium]|nr:peptide deformylase [Legionellales bacterium]|tara:strand:- start:365 stop:880 length:516 start_codon:yes stop_codon:yes gene_type:complete